MGHCHIESRNATKELCIVNAQWDKHKHQRLLMGACDSSGVFQEKMNNLLDGLDTVPVCIDEILHMTNGSWEDHHTGLEEVFKRLQQARLKVKAKKSNFGAHKMEWLGCNVASTGMQPVAKKVQAIQAGKVPKTPKQLQGHIGMINFYRNMWKSQASLLALPTALTSKSVPYKWTDEHEKNFYAIKHVIS
jgi:hypothetical protein